MHQSVMHGSGKHFLKRMRLHKTAYFRSTPNEYEDNVICTIPLNTKVGFIEVTDSVFSRVEYNGQYGYVKSEFLGEYPESVSAPIDRGKGTMKEATAMAI